MREFLKNLFAISETRTSTLVFTFMVVLGFALQRYFVSGDFGENMKILLMTYISVIGGVNVTSDLVYAFKKNNNDMEG